LAEHQNVEVQIVDIKIKNRKRDLIFSRHSQLAEHQNVEVQIVDIKIKIEKGI
jgi:hypothetical protein